MNVKEIGEVIRESIEAVRDQGLVIRPGSYGVHTSGSFYVCDGPGCCAMAAVILHKKVPVKLGIVEDIAEYLGVSVTQVESFTHGFDYTWRTGDDMDMRKLGEGVALELGLGPGMARKKYLG